MTTTTVTELSNSTRAAHVALLARELSITKFEPDNVTPALREYATAYAVNYQGNFSFMLEMRTAARKGLSVGQSKAVANCMLAEARRNTEDTQRGAVNMPFEGIAHLFTTAREHLKFPKIRLQTSDGEKIVIRQSGDRAKAPGAITITSKGSFEDRKFYGLILTDGTYQGRAPATVLDVLGRFATDPAKVASEYGRLLGNCCFCGRNLADERSTAVGYGETCAGHYGLPWGKVAS